jgi:CRP-like cAMP-binding protein
MNYDQMFVVGQSEMRELLPYAVGRRFSKGEILWAEGERSEMILIIQSGLLQMFFTAADGSMRLTHRFGEHHAACAVAAVSGRRHSCGALAATDIEALSVPRRRFTAIFDRLPELLKGMLGAKACEICDRARGQEAGPFCGHDDAHHKGISGPALG